MNSTSPTMLKKFLPLLWLTAVHTLLAQPAFHTYSTAGFQHMIRTPENDLIACGRTYSGDASELWKLDASGNVLWSKTLPFPASTYIKRISVTNDHHYLLCGAYPLGQGQSSLLFVKFDTDGNLLATTFPNPGKRFNTDNLYQLDDQSFAVVGVSGSFGTPNYAVLKLDSTLSQIVSLEEHPVESDTFFTSWQALERSALSPDKQSLVALCADAATGTSINSDSYVIKSTTNGQILWKTKIDNGKDDQARGMRLLADQSILVTGLNTLGKWPTWEQRLFLTKIDADGTILWQQFFAGTAPDTFLRGTDLLELPTGDLLVTGQKIGYAHTDIFLLLTDKNGLEKNRLILERNDHEDYPWSLVLLDNNLLAIGGYQDEFFLHRNLLVTLPLSLISQAREISVDNPEFQLSPNPCQTSVQMKYTGPEQSKPAFRLEIYSGAGKQLYAGPTVSDFNLEQFPGGIYYFVLRNPITAKLLIRRVVKQ